MVWKQSSQVVLIISKVAKTDRTPFSQILARFDSKALSGRPARRRDAIRHRRLLHLHRTPHRIPLRPTTLPHLRR